MFHFYFSYRFKFSPEIASQAEISGLTLIINIQSSMVPFLEAGLLKIKVLSVSSCRECEEHLEDMSEVLLPWVSSNK